ncbi:MAG: hypothetical protein HY221_02470 [Candidatus Sungbacteria bacterium]|uniref:Uncharacterized protein n=1 Tax=Candidatus Sungiibacteriota bacterium TaxID=2750080 RepID=A0A932R1W5_9BACT|nr:hypothetical protein [Candidatus Sungbacteria bacterium]
MTQSWEMLSRDDKLDYLKKQLDDMNALLNMLVKSQREIIAHLAAQQRQQQTKQSTPHG